MRLGVDDGKEAFDRGSHLLLGEREVLPGVAEGLVVDGGEARQPAAYLPAAGEGDGPVAVRRSGLIGGGEEGLGQVVLAQEAPGQEVGVLVEPGALHQGGVVGMVVGDPEGRAMLEALHQEADAVAEQRPLRPHEEIQAALCGPPGGGVEEEAGHGGVVDGVEAPEEGRPGAVVLVEVAMVGHRDAPHRLAVLLDQEEGGLGVAVEGVAAAVEGAGGIGPDGGHPLRAVPIQGEGERHEAAHVGTAGGIDGVQAQSGATLPSCPGQAVRAGAGTAADDRPDAG